MTRPSSTPLQFLVVGAGSRGHAYATAVTKATSSTIAVVVDTNTYARDAFGRKYIWGTSPARHGQSFASVEDFVEWELQRRETLAKGKIHQHEVLPNIAGVFICTLDATHASMIQHLAPLKLHILCEKPLALSLSDCLGIQSILSPPTKIVSIGHVLRYSPHNTLLRKLLLEEQRIGEIVSIEHTEPVGWWHFSHSYVRGNWRRSTPEGVGSLLTKSCHDVDFLLWLLCSPSSLTGDTAHLPARVSSFGSLSHFTKSRKPKKAETATNCLNCNAEPDCIYSAKKIYVERWCRQERDTGWPLKIVCPEIEDVVAAQGWKGTEEAVLERLGDNYDAQKVSGEEIANRAWYGRCVYESDNDVCDEQTVVMQWDDDRGIRGRGPKTAVFHMAYATQAQCQRRGRVYGSLGEITYDAKSIIVHEFANGQIMTYDVPKQAPEVEKAHGGGDWGLAGAFVDAVQAVERGHMGVAEAQRKFVGCDLDEIVRSHAVVFAAEEARLTRQIVEFPAWWRRYLNKPTSCPLKLPIEAGKSCGHLTCGTRRSRLVSSIL